MKQLKIRHGRITDDTNPVITENLSAARSMHELEEFKKRHREPMMEKVVKVMQMFVKLKMCSPNLAYKTVNDYLYSKHAPERNRHICIGEVIDKLTGKLSSEERRALETSGFSKAVEAIYDMANDDSLGIETDRATQAQRQKDIDDFINLYKKNKYEATRLSIMSKIQ